MKIAILHNNLNKFGGGENVSINIMDELSRQGHEVKVYTLKKPEINDLNDFYGIILHENIEFIHYKLKILYRSYYADYFLARKLSKMEGFDVIIDTSSNGFYPVNNPNSRNICYVHFPMLKKPDSSISKIYSAPIYHKMGYNYGEYDTVMVNSNFTRKYLETNNYMENKREKIDRTKQRNFIHTNKKYSSTPISVVYPPVTNSNTLKDYKKISKYKENIILVVGRLAPDKKMLFLIEEFKKISEYNSHYQMHIVGPTTPYHPDYLKILVDASRDYPVKFHTQISKRELNCLYQKSRIYWHAKGYNVSDPMLFEHFGISTAEAMNNGCIPIVINKGGQKEIVDDGINGFLWDSADQLYKQTVKVISGQVNASKMVKNAMEKSQKFDNQNFRDAINRIINR